MIIGLEQYPISWLLAWYPHRYSSSLKGDAARGRILAVSTKQSMMDNWFCLLYPVATKTSLVCISLQGVDLKQPHVGVYILSLVASSSSLPLVNHRKLPRCWITKTSAQQKEWYIHSWSSPQVSKSKLSRTVGGYPLWWGQPILLVWQNSLS